MRPKVVIDTNKARNDKGFEQLLGNRAEIQKFAEKCDIILPTMVIDEIIHQKKSYFEVSKQSFTGGHLYKKLTHEIQTKIDAQLQFDENALRNDQSIPFTAIDVIDKSEAFIEIRKLAVKHEAPFEVYSVELGKGKTINTDKGFKDAYIAMTIIQYVNTLPNNEKVFVLIRDRRFEEYLDKYDRVICIANFDDFSERYREPEPRSTTSQRRAHIVPVTRARQEIKDLLTEFRNTPNFASTHNLVSKLTAASVANKLTDDDYLDILDSTANNNQISWLLGDDDVRDLVLPIFKKYGERLNAAQYNTIAPSLGLESVKVPTMAPDIDYDDMDGMVDSWIELQSDISRGH